MNLISKYLQNCITKVTIFMFTIYFVSQQHYRFYNLPVEYIPLITDDSFHLTVVPCLTVVGSKICEHRLRQCLL